jgi:catechol 2,3-dioxygenase-like lactoylglutathione lyase family enzyme
MPRAVDHYTKLGFEVTHFNETYAFAEHGKLNLHLDLFDGAVASPGCGILYIHCDDADEVAAEWRRAGLEVTGPEHKPWGQNEGAHVDPDGNVIRFGSPRNG